MLAVWLAMAAAAALYVARYASTIPTGDDDEMIGPSCGETGIRWSWLWSQHNEHRVPIARLIYVGLMRLFRDPHAVMYAEVAILASLALGMILAARSIRGRTEISDAFFPLLWLHWGNAQNLLTAFQLAVILPVGLMGAVLVLVSGLSRAPSSKHVILLGSCALLLPLNGGQGLSQAPALIGWLALAGIWSMRSGDPGTRLRGRVLAAAAVLSVILAGIYFRGLVPTSSRAPTHDPGRTFLTCGQFLTLALGPVGKRAWPFSFAIAAGICLFAVRTLWKAIRKNPAEGLRASGILCVLAGVVTMGLTVGWMRGDLGWAGFASRYVSLSSLALCCAYFAWCLYGTRPAERIGPWALCALMLAALPTNTREGIRYGREQRRLQLAFRSDVAQGMSLKNLAAKNADSFYSTPASLERSLILLRDAGFPPFEADK